jgi:CDP-4-dehydro-6-deoxyglucose reductase
MNAPPLVTGRLHERRAATWRGDVVRIEVPDSARAVHLRPGQFCRIAVGELTGCFAITTPPGRGPLEFYVQRGGPVADALLGLPVGAAVQLSPPQGPGFPVAEALAGGGPIYLAATGSGLAALRPVAAAAGRRAVLYAGCRQPDDFVYLPDVLGSGATVHLVLSQAGAAWSGRRGYVQDALAGDAPDLSNAWVFVCGVPAMVEGVRSAALRLGARPERVRTNY